MREALALVRGALGSDAAVLHTRELNTGPIARLLRGRRVEIVARPADASDKKEPAPEPFSLDLETPAEPPAMDFPLLASAGEAYEENDVPHHDEFRHNFRNRVSERLDDLHAMVESLCDQPKQSTQPSAEPKATSLPDSLFQIFTKLLEADVDEATARELIEEAQHDLPEAALDEPILVEEHVTASVRDALTTCGPIETGDAEQGICRIAALVGPTGVGKTTTIAKLAANFRIREQRSVGLITVDTFRVAAVEQLRTYAEIIDLPMEVVSTPREMREAVERLRHLDVILIDTAGRSPKDAVRLQELRALLGEATPDEVHLVLSTTTTARGLNETIRQFEGVGVTSLLLTKLDEAMTLGQLVGVARSNDLPISYLTDGQQVPDDIRIAQSDSLARLLLEAGV